MIELEITNTDEHRVSKLFKTLPNAWKQVFRGTTLRVLSPIITQMWSCDHHLVGFGTWLFSTTFLVCSIEFSRTDNSCKVRITSESADIVFRNSEEYEELFAQAIKTSLEGS